MVVFVVTIEMVVFVVTIEMVEAGGLIDMDSTTFTAKLIPGHDLAYATRTGSVRGRAGAGCFT